MGPLGAEGVFLGLHRSSNSYVVATSDGKCVRTRAVTRRPERERWDAQALADICQLPRESRDRGEAARRPFDGPAGAHGPTTEATRPAPIRRMRINKSDLAQYGFHQDCPNANTSRSTGTHNLVEHTPTRAASNWKKPWPGLKKDVSVSGSTRSR